MIKKNCPYASLGPDIYSVVSIYSVINIYSVATIQRVLPR